MENINITLNLYSSLICLVLVGYLALNESRNEKLSRYFIYMTLANVGMLLGDIPAWACDGFAKPWFPLALCVGSLIFWCCTAPLQYYYTCYVIEFISIKKAVPKSVRRTAGFLCLAHLIGSVVSLWNGMFWYVGEGNTYQRGDWFWLSQAIPFLVYIIDALLIICYRNYVHKKDIVFFLSYIFLPIMAQLVQIFNFGIALVNTGAALAMLLVFLNIQLEQEMRLKRQQIVLKQKEKELAESRIDIMLSQIQPHFLYNTLTAIRQLCDINPKQAKQATTDFANFLRANMNSLTNKAPIPFMQELTNVQNYLNLERQRYIGRIHVVYKIYAKNFFIPALTLQPIVENAVRHGVTKKEQGGTITICTQETASAYMITVSDDGVGFTGKLEDHSDEHIHVGIDNVRYRLWAINKGTLDISSTLHVGTTVVLTIPKEKMEG